MPIPMEPEDEHPLRAVILEDQTMFRQMLRAVMSELKSVEVAAEFERAEDLFQAKDNLVFDFLLVDVVLPGLSGAELIRQLRDTFQDARLLVVSGHSEPGIIQEIVRIGVDGYVLKDSPIGTLREAVEAVATGGAYFDQTASKAIRQSLSGQSAETLTPREKRILELIADGYPSKVIAQLLSVSVKTVENQRSAIMRKLGITSIAGLTRYAVAKGLVASGLPPRGGSGDVSSA